MKLVVGEVGKIGVIQDLQDSGLPPQAWTDGLNVKAKNGSMQTLAGRISIAVDPTIQPTLLMSSDTNADDTWTYCGWDDVVTAPSVFTIGGDGLHTDRTPTTNFTSDEDVIWTGTTFGDFPIINDSQSAPHYWDGQAATKYVPLPNFPANTTAENIRSFNGYLIAADVNESGTRNKRLVMWSDGSDPGTLPNSWDYTDPTIEAGRNELSAEGGGIIDLLELNGAMIVYRETNTYAMQWVKGAYIFNFQRLFSGWGPIGKRCITELAARHWCFGGNDLYVHDGATINSVVSGKQRDYIYNSIDKTHKNNCYVVSNPAENEVWFCYPESGNTYPTKAFVYNVLTGLGGFRDLPHTPSFAASGVTTPIAGDYWNDATTTWDDATGVWDEGAAYKQRITVLSCSKDGKKIYVEDNGFGNDGADITSWLERENLPLKLKPETPITTITSIRPYLELTGNITASVYVGSKRTQTGGLVWSGPYTFDPTTDYKVSCRVSGRHPAIRFVFTGQGKAVLNGYEVDYQLRGGR